MLTVTVTFVTIPKKRKEFHQSLGAIVELANKVAGCRDAHYGMDPWDANRFILTIEWDHAKSWEDYRRTDEYKALIGMKNLLAQDHQVVVRDIGGRPSAT